LKKSNFKEKVYLLFYKIYLLNKKSAKFAVLGNHDYGDYTDWHNEEERIQNRVQINKAITDFGFRLLLNENVYLRKGTDSLLMVGVENWGKSEKARYSDLKKALKGSSTTEPKILLSHDPNHWEAEVIGRKDIVLTLAGHTHAAQLGIKVGNRLFSPAAFVFKYWEGLYKVNQQYLYVNRGIGYIGLPMQIGVQPEITIIKLKK
jgi:predicted MPP superfamily phosphohydrolase